MQIRYLRRIAAWVFAAACAATFAVSPAAADKPDWAGGGKPEKHDRDRGNHQDRRDDRRGDDSRRGYDRDDRRDERRAGDERRGDRDGRDGRDHRADDRRGRDRDRRVAHFDDRHRGAIRDYYAREYRGARCPPGLAKKGNHCQPPGQAKKWRVGRPLPRDVIFYDLPPAIIVELGVPPAGHRFVRVAGDILLIAVGTGMVIDAIEDLGRL